MAELAALHESIDTHSTIEMDTELLESIRSCATLTGALLLQSPSNEAIAQTTRELRAMDVVREWPFGTANERSDAANLLSACRDEPTDRLDREYHHSFVGPQYLEAPPWGSVYLDSESVVFGDSCIALTRWMRANGIALHESSGREPADHIGRMLVLLGWLCENDPALVEEYVRLHLNTWAPVYFKRFDDAAAESPFYRAVARLASLMLRDIACRGQVK